MDSLARSQIRIDASLTSARSLAASLSYTVATHRHCLILLKNRSIRLRARYRYRLKRIGSFRFRFVGNSDSLPNEVFELQRGAKQRLELFGRRAARRCGVGMVRHRPRHCSGDVLLPESHLAKRPR